MRACADHAGWRRTNLAQQVMAETPVTYFWGEEVMRLDDTPEHTLAEEHQPLGRMVVYDPRLEGAESYIRLAKE